MVDSSVKSTKHCCSGGVFLDWNDWPLVVVRPPPHPVDATALETFVQHSYLPHVLERAQPYVLLLDLRHASPMSPGGRQQLKDTLVGARDEFAEHCVASAMVFHSPIMRSLTTAMMWMSRPPYPMRTFREIQPAMDWCLAMMPSELRAAG